MVDRKSRDAPANRADPRHRSDAKETPSLPEIFVGFVAPIGGKLSSVINATKKALIEIGYQSEKIKITDHFAWALPDQPIPDRNARVDLRYVALMDAGDELRKRADHNGAAVLPALQGIAEARADATGVEAATTPAVNLAYLLDSLKTPEEVQLLRAIYGARFVLIAAYSAKTKRQANLEDRIKDGPKGGEAPEPNRLAEELVERDEEGTTFNRFGQNVRDAFPLADLIITADVADGVIDKQVERFFDLLFRTAESRHLSPTRLEQAMFIAFAASLRSASLSRQVGAAIITDDGAVVSTGTNEAPKYRGGAYWGTDHEDTDGRTINFVPDPSRARRDALIENLIARLRRWGWSPPEAAHANETNQSLVTAFREWQDRQLREGLPAGLLIDQLIEFNREVHAEMLALTDAALRGVGVEGCELVTTTFPCDDCAKHAVAAGIKTITFLEPYAKSIIRDLHPDSLHVDGETRNPRWEKLEQLPLETFVGVAPRRYPVLFRLPARRRATEPRLRLADYEGATETGLEQTDVRASITHEAWVYLELLKKVEDSKEA